VAQNFINKQVDYFKYRVIQQENKGLPATRNIGIAIAEGEFILPLDSDDTIQPTCLEIMSRVLDNNPKIHIVGCDTNRFGLINTPYGTCEFLEQMSSGEGNMMNYCSMYRKTVWEEVGGYNEEILAGPEDWDFWMNCLDHKFKLRKLPMLLFNYRIHTKGKSQRDILLGPEFRKEEDRKILVNRHVIKESN
jgi:glycosyltransferase involved in cell wall biosynthesis